MNQKVKENLMAKNKWLRLLFMVIFAIVIYVLCAVVALIILFQFFTTLFVNKANDKLLAFSRNLNTYIYQIFCFLTYTSETKPFPFSSWPTSGGNEKPEKP